MNRMLTRVCNWFTDLDLTDVETCYKAVRTTSTAIDSAPEPRLSDRDRARYEAREAAGARLRVPIRYLPRSIAEAEDRRGRPAGARRAHPVRAPGRPTTPTSMDPTY